MALPGFRPKRWSLFDLFRQEERDSLREAMEQLWTEKAQVDEAGPTRA